MKCKSLEKGFKLENKMFFCHNNMKMEIKKWGLKW